MDRGADRSLARAAGAVSAATLVSRVLGVAREAVQAALFGAGIETDAFFIAYRIPNMLRDLFAEGALSAAFVPTFTATLKKKGEAAAWRLANSVIGVLAVLLGLGGAVIWFAAPALVVFLAPGFRAEPGKIDLASGLTQVLSPFLLFVALAAVMMGVLNVFGRFFLPALAPAAFNAVVIGVTLAMYPLAVRMDFPPIYALAIGALAGVAAQYVVQLPVAYRLGYRFRPAPRISDPGVRRMAWLMLPATFGLAATQINLVIDSQLASRWEGAISWLQYAFRLMYLPIGLVGVAIGTASLAAVSRDAAEGNMDALRRRVASAVRLVLVVALPATAGLIALREPIIRILFERGRFEASDTEATAQVLLAYAVGLAAYSCIKVIVPTFYALGDTATPVRVSFASVGVKIVSALLLIRILEYRGLALSTSLVAIFNVGLLWVLLSRRLGGFAGLGVGRVFWRSAAVSAAMGGICAWTWSLASPRLPAGLLPEVALVGGIVLLGMLLTVAFSGLVGIDEVISLIGRVVPRTGRGSGKR